MSKKYSQIDQKTETEKIVSSSFGLLFDAGGTRLSGLKGLVMAPLEICPKRPLLNVWRMMLCILYRASRMHDGGHKRADSGVHYKLTFI